MRLIVRSEAEMDLSIAYAIFFLVREDTVVVVCVSHQARDPEHWKERV